MIDTRDWRYGRKGRTGDRTRARKGTTHTYATGEIASPIYPRPAQDTYDPEATARWPRWQGRVRDRRAARFASPRWCPAVNPRTRDAAAGLTVMPNGRVVLG